jgi:hypothetical protein
MEAPSKKNRKDRESKKISSPATVLQYSEKSPNKEVKKYSRMVNRLIDQYTLLKKDSAI